MGRRTSSEPIPHPLELATRALPTSRSADDAGGGPRPALRPFRKTEAYAKAYADFRKEAPDLSKAQAEDFIRSYFAETYLSQ